MGKVPKQPAKCPRQWLDPVYLPLALDAGLLDTTDPTRGRECAPGRNRALGVIPHGPLIPKNQSNIPISTQVKLAAVLEHEHVLRRDPPAVSYNILLPGAGRGVGERWVSGTLALADTEE